MISKNTVKISVRNLVEFVLRCGNIDSKFMGSSRAVEGTYIHKKLEKSGEKKYEKLPDSSYTSEVKLVYTIDYKGLNFNIEGRADGIIVEKNEVTIDEIKTTTKPLKFIEQDYNVLHWAQAKCYAYIYSLQNGIKKINVRLTYYNLDTKEIKYFIENFNITELERFFYDLLDKYFVWAKCECDWTIKRNKSIKQLQFPFNSYRKGQRDLAAGVYCTIKQSKNIFVQAPTGIGKTMSVLFPSVKAMAEGYVSKIFYLTAKTITRQTAEQTIDIMRDSGLNIKSLTLTAKDKICFKAESNCSPEYCEFAKGHFDRVNDAIMDILNNEDCISREIVEKYALKYKICPFEFSLDLAVWVDCVICDYNYVFDPRVSLKSFLIDRSSDYVFLIDEAHNLVDRSREMFSTELYKSDVLDVKKLIKDSQPKISKILAKINSFMLTMKRKCGEDGCLIQKDFPKDIYPILENFIKKLEKWLPDNENKTGYNELLELYFNVRAFVKTIELYDERYVTYVTRFKREVKIKLFCLDPSYLLRQVVKKGRSSVFFSATLTPISYFREILGGDESDYGICLPSPFNTKNRSIIIADRISTKYKYRKYSYDIIVQYIKEVVDKKKGNYLAFFPSYEYMNEVSMRFVEKYPHIKVIKQTLGMSEKEREEFLSRFSPDSDETLLGFAVLGGIFSESVDLKGERLSGVIVTGVGLPKICFERNIIMNYFKNKNNLGFEYAYIYPGMNKVLQAAGRVIRSQEDKGVILLIDERFSYSSYRRLFPEHWYPYIRAGKIEDVRKYITNFWNQIKLQV